MYIIKSFRHFKTRQNKWLCKNGLLREEMLVSALASWFMLGVFCVGMRKLLGHWKTASHVQIIFVSDTSGSALWWLSRSIQALVCVPAKVNHHYFKRSR